MTAPRSFRSMGTDSTNTELRSPVVGDHEAMVALNNEFSAETSVLSASAMRALIDAAFFVSVAGSMEGFRIALDQAAAYDNPNFNWFRDKLHRFIYVDRVVVAKNARGLGVAGKMYRALTVAAKAAGHTVLCCEVNIAPPNPISDRFHEKFGFSEIGQARLPDRGKTVRYLMLPLHACLARSAHTHSLLRCGNARIGRDFHAGANAPFAARSPTCNLFKVYIGAQVGTGGEDPATPRCAARAWHCARSEGRPS